MPIGNNFLSNHRTLLVQNPVFDLSGKIPTLQGSATFEIACKNFSVQTQTGISNKTLIQDWPAAKYLDIKPFVYITKIDIPVILDMNGIHVNEFSFFSNWLQYMLNSFDTIEGSSYTLASLVVEEASINISENEVLLSLSFKSNFPLSWGPSAFGAASTQSKSLHARKAKYYDTFIKFNEYSDGPVNSNAILGFNNTYGISNFKITYQSELEEICLSMHEFNDEITIDSSTLLYPHLTDMINVKTINYNGEITIFGPEMEVMGTSTQTAWLNNFSPISQDIFSMDLDQGAMQIYIGYLDLTISPNYSHITPLTFLPTGTMISNASYEFSGGQICKHNRQFYGVFTDTPKQVLQDGSIITTSLS